jgi:hypothetical protein
MAICRQCHRQYSTSIHMCDDGRCLSCRLQDADKKSGGWWWIIPAGVVLVVYYILIKGGC